MIEPSSPPQEAPEPVFELHFGPRALARSRLQTVEGAVFQTGQKGAEVRWQQGAIAVCILLVYTRLRYLEGDAEPPVLEGERGSPARSLDNLLTKPGDWALNMFGEERQMPAIRDYLYRKKAVSKSNPVSAVRWDADKLPVERIRLYREGEELATAEELRAFLRVLLEEFNPRRAQREWEALVPPPPAASLEPVEAETTPRPAFAGPPAAPSPPTEPPLAMGPSPASAEPGLQRPWVLLVVLVAFFTIGAFFLGQSMAPVARPSGETTTREVGAASASAAAVSRFIEYLNAQALDQAYAITRPGFREEVPPEAFAVAFGGQRFNFPRIAGNPYRNRPDSLVHEYRVTLYVETEVFRIPPLEGLARAPVTEIERYAEGIEALTRRLREAGVDPAFIRQLRKDRLERPDASRHIQLICGLNDAEMAALYPERITVTLDLTFFFELVREPGSDEWRIQSLADATDRLVTF